MSDFTNELGYIPTYDDSDVTNKEELIVEDKERRVFACPSCAGANIILQGRCITCTDCGWSSCVL